MQPDNNLDPLKVLRTLEDSGDYPVELILVRPRLHPVYLDHALTSLMKWITTPLWVKLCVVIGV